MTVVILSILCLASNGQVAALSGAFTTEKACKKAEAEFKADPKVKKQCNMMLQTACNAQEVRGE
jgi:hypothetical protein